MSAVLEFFVEILLAFVWWLILFPAVWLMSAPFILVTAVFRPRPYTWAVSDGFRSVTRFWSEWGMLLLP